MGTPAPARDRQRSQTVGVDVTACVVAKGVHFKSPVWHNFLLKVLCCMPNSFHLAMLIVIFLKASFDFH